MSTWIIGLLLAILSSMGSLHATNGPYGINQNKPIQGYLNGKLPKGLGLPDSFSVGYEEAFPNLRFDHPVWMGPEPGTNRLFVIERRGVLWAFENDRKTSKKEMILDIQDRVEKVWDGGFSVLAFHPEYGQANSPNKDYIYVFYSSKTSFYSNGYLGGGQAPFAEKERNHDNTLARYTRTKKGRFSKESELIYFKQQDNVPIHDGGGMCFGNDNFLYITLGDEGDQGAAARFTTQKLDERLMSGVLRIDIDQRPERSHPIRRSPIQGYSQNYSIPNSNPWLDENGGVLEEFYAIGLRSPWRMSCDKKTGLIIESEVGLKTREEVNIIRKGRNYQWPYMEGTSLGPVEKPENLIGIEQPPLWDYGRKVGRAVIGGYIYHGDDIPSLKGKYIFGDNNRWHIWAMEVSNLDAPVVNKIGEVPNIVQRKGLSSFGVDHRGEMYFLILGDDGGRDGNSQTQDDNNGVIYRLARPTRDDSQKLPTKLSETGAFTDLETLTPSPGLIPYKIVSPLWSDNASKTRYMAIPNGANGIHDEGHEKIRFSKNGNWEFPEGTVFIKHFELPIDERDPELKVRLETRFLTVMKGGQVYGATYVWNDEGTEAILLPNSSKTRELQVTRLDGTVYNQTWTYPSRNDCRQCHTSAMPILGPRTFQLNSQYKYPESKIIDNQLRTLNHLALFDTQIDENLFEKYPRGAAIHDESASLQRRVRSYVHSNCASCHQLGVAQAHWDGRYHKSLSATKMLNGPVNKDFGIQDAKVIKPGMPDLSMIYIRGSDNGERKMPLLGRSLVDEEAMEVVRRWIETLDERVEAPSVTTGEFEEFNYPNFKNVDSLTFNGDAKKRRKRLRLTRLKKRSKGSVFRKEPLLLKEGYGFSTQFSFKMNGRRNGGEGLALILHSDPRGASALGRSTKNDGQLGLEGLTPSIAVALDVYEPDNSKINTIKLIKNGVSNKSETQRGVPFDLEDGRVHFVWVDYRPENGLLQVYLARDKSIKPAQAFLEYSVDLEELLGKEFSIGLTASTGKKANKHQILDWSLKQVKTGAVGHSYTVGKFTGDSYVQSQDFYVDISFDRAIAGLEIEDFVIENGEVLGLSGQGQAYSLLIRARQAGIVEINLPSDKVVDAGLNTNGPSRAHSVQYEPAFN